MLIYKGKYGVYSNFRYESKSEPISKIGGWGAEGKERMLRDEED
jgi:hypothetical protein